MTREQLVRAARARALGAAVWAVGNVVIAGLLIAFADGSPTGRVFGVLGGTLVVGALVALCLTGVNLALARRPDRADAGGAADFLTVAAGFAAVAALVLALLLGRPYAAVTLALGLVWLVQFASLVGLALGTRAGARHPLPVAAGS